MWEEGNYLIWIRGKLPVFFRRSGMPDLSHAKRCPRKDIDLAGDALNLSKVTENIKIMETYVPRTGGRAGQ